MNGIIGKIRAPRRFAARLLLGCLAVRALIPLGYMPGDALAGELFVLCPNGLPAEVARALHAGHGAHDDSIVDADRDCPIGSALNLAALPADVIEQAEVSKAQPALAAHIGSVCHSVAARCYRSRAPPLR